MEDRKAIEVGKKLGISFEPLLRSLFFFFFYQIRQLELLEGECVTQSSNVGNKIMVKARILPSFCGVVVGAFVVICSR